MKPSDFRKANPHLSDGALAVAYAHAEGIGADVARDAFERWDKVLLGEFMPSFVGIDWASTSDEKEQG